MKYQKSRDRTLSPVVRRALKRGGDEDLRYAIDGNGAYVTIKRADGIEQNFWDGTGHAQYCGGPFYPTSEIVQFKVCEHHIGCTGWRT